MTRWQGGIEVDSRMITTSDFDGRLRVRDTQLHDPAVAEEIRQAFSANPEIHEVRANVQAGSILVLYQPTPGVRERVMGGIRVHLRAPDSAPAPSKPGGRRSRVPQPKLVLSRRRVLHGGMLTTLGLSLFGAVLDLKKLHVLSGALFLAVLALHIATKRRLLFA